MLVLVLVIVLRTRLSHRGANVAEHPSIRVPCVIVREHNDDHEQEHRLMPEEEDKFEFEDDLKG